MYKITFGLACDECRWFYYHTKIHQDTIDLRYNSISLLLHRQLLGFSFLPTPFQLRRSECRTAFLITSHTHPIADLMRLRFP